MPPKLYAEDFELCKVDVVEYLAKHLTTKQIEKRKIPKYYKPRVRHEKLGQYPFRCPICWQKYLYREQAQDCLDKCWENIFDKVIAKVEELKQAPKEIGSWQWDLDDNHHNYCAVGFFTKGRIVYATNIGRGFREITQEEFIRIMEQATVKWLFQDSDMELPDPLKKYATIPRQPIKKDNRSAWDTLKNDIAGEKD